MDSTDSRDPSAAADLAQPIPTLNSALPLPEPDRRQSTITGILAMVLLAYLMGVFATAMNRAFYVHHAPFFDSCGYYTWLAARSPSPT